MEPIGVLERERVAEEVNRQNEMSVQPTLISLPDSLRATVIHSCALHTIQKLFNALPLHVTKHEVIPNLDASIALLYVRHNVTGYSELAGDNPSRIDPLVLSYVLRHNPKRFFDLPIECQANRYLRMRAYLEAFLRYDHALCARLMISEFQEITAVLDSTWSYSLRQYGGRCFGSTDIDQKKKLFLNNTHTTVMHSAEAVYALLSDCQEDLIGAIFPKLPDDVRENSSFILHMVSQKGHLLQHVAPRFKEDAGIVHAAVCENGGALCFACDTLRDNESIVYRAVCENGCALCYASSRLQNVKYIAVAAVRSTGFALQYIDRGLLNDPDIKQAFLESQLTFYEKHGYSNDIVERIAHTLGLTVE